MTLSQFPATFLDERTDALKWRTPPRQSGKILLLVLRLLESRTVWRILRTRGSLLFDAIHVCG